MVKFLEICDIHESLRVEKENTEEIKTYITKSIFSTWRVGGSLWMDHHDFPNTKLLNISSIILFIHKKTKSEVEIKRIHST